MDRHEAPIQQNASPQAETEGQSSAGLSQAPPQFSLEAGTLQAKSAGTVQRQTGGNAISDTVNIVKSHAGGTGAGYLTGNLIRGIIEAEGMFLRENPVNRWGESLGLSGTVGPGQLGKSAVDQVDGSYAAAVTAFAAKHGAAPADYKDKATHPQWQYFYIGAYLAWCISRCEQIFHSDPPLLSNPEIGLLDLGIAFYHGAFETIKALRARVAQEQGVAKPAVTADMVDDELRSGTATRGEMNLEEYTQLARGYFDFGFEIDSTLLSRRFQIFGGKAKITSKADYQSATPIDANRASTYKIRLEKFEVAGGPGGAIGEGTNWYPFKEYTVGRNQVAEWTDLPKGDYRFKVMKNESSFTQDVLEGNGKVETMY